VVRDFNTRIQFFPDVLVARTLGFRERDFFELEDASEAEVPKVRF
jgi:LemA protein